MSEDLCMNCVRPLSAHIKVDETYFCYEHSGDAFDPMTDLGDMAFAGFATIYPHEVYEAYPEKFWTYYQKRVPGISREEMEQRLKNTEDQKT